MTFTVDLPASLEQRIRDRAAQLGGTPETIVANVVREDLQEGRGGDSMGLPQSTEI